MMGDRIISRAGGSREETIDVLFTRSEIEIVTTHTPSSVEEGVVVEETAEFCRTAQIGCIGVGVGADGGVY